MSKEKTEIRINIENSKKELDELIKKFDKIDEKQLKNLNDNAAALTQKFERCLNEFKSYKEILFFINFIIFIAWFKYNYSAL